MQSDYPIAWVTYCFNLPEQFWGIYSVTADRPTNEELSAIKKRGAFHSVTTVAVRHLPHI